jgi:hypothetical protein
MNRETRSREFFVSLLRDAVEGAGVDVGGAGAGA